MDSATLGVAAFSIAIGFSLTEVLFWHRRRGVRYATVMLLSTGLVLGFTRYVVQPYVHTTPTVRVAASSQLLAAVERLEPATTFGMTPGGAAAYPAQLRRRSVATMAKHAWKSSDAAILVLGETLVRNAQALQRHDPSLCVSYLFPTSDRDATDYTRYLDEIAMKQDLMALTGVLESAAISTRGVATAGDREHGIRALRTRLSDRYTTTDFERFDQRQPVAGRDRAFTCRLAIDLYREALTLPPTQRAVALRILMSS
jgi:hypothetical protein